MFPLPRLPIEDKQDIIMQAVVLVQQATRGEMKEGFGP